MSDNLQSTSLKQSVYPKSINNERISYNHNSYHSNRSFTNAIRMKVVNNNFRGRTVDKITAEQSRPTTSFNQSIYGTDFIVKRRATSSSIDPRRDRGGANQGRYLNTSMIVHQYNPNDLSVLSQNQESSFLQDEKIDTAKQIIEITQLQSDEGGANNTKTCSYDLNHPMAHELNAIVDENVEYFNHVTGNCVCTKCTCGKHKCRQQGLKIKKKIPPTTIYQKDFMKHQLGEPPKQLKNDFFTTVYNNETMSLATTMKTDYKSWNVGAPPRAKDPTTFAVVPFGGKSAYRGDFVNWKAGPVHIEKASYPLTTINQLPFFPKTTYKDGFGTYAPSLTLSQKKQNEKSPLSPGVPFLGETTTMKTYKPFKMGTNPNYKQQEEKWESIDSYPDQFSSTFNKDFTPPNKGKCPATDLYNSDRKPDKASDSSLLYFAHHSKSLSSLFVLASLVAVYNFFMKR